MTEINFPLFLRLNSKRLLFGRGVVLLKVDHPHPHPRGVGSRPRRGDPFGTFGSESETSLVHEDPGSFRRHGSVVTTGVHLHRELKETGWWDIRCHRRRGFRVLYQGAITVGDRIPLIDTNSPRRWSGPQPSSSVRRRPQVRSSDNHGTPSLS